jgi:hypothetical protein
MALLTAMRFATTATPKTAMAVQPIVVPMKAVAMALLTFAKAVTTLMMTTKMDVTMIVASLDAAMGL